MAFTVGKERCSMNLGIAVEDNMLKLRDPQRECMRRFSTKIQAEQESYLLNHPEIKAMLKGFYKKITQLQVNPKEILKEAALHFTRPDADIKHETKELLELSPDKSHISFLARDSIKASETKHFLKFIDAEYISKDSMELTLTEDSNTSSFISIISSASTLMTPEEVSMHELTSSEIFREEILKIVNKAVYYHVTDEDLQYDIAYEEVMNVIELAMEIPVIEIRKDLAALLDMAYYMFEFQIEEKKMLVQAARENKIKKKLRRLQRWRNCYKGYETSVIAKSEVSSNDSLMKADSCIVQCKYNRYAKDCFGVYLPRKTKFSNESVTAVVPIEETGLNTHIGADIDATSLKSFISMKSGVVIATLSDKPISSSKYGTNKKMSFIVKGKTFEGEEFDKISKLTSANINLFKPTHTLYKQD